MAINRFDLKQCCLPLAAYQLLNSECDSHSKLPATSGSAPEYPDMPIPNDVKVYRLISHHFLMTPRTIAGDLKFLLRLVFISGEPLCQCLLA